MNPDRLAELEEERRFLLRSLDDLEREWAAGDVDDVDYQALKDGYTVRAAATLRELEQGRSTLPAKPTPNWPRRALAFAVVAVLIGVVWWALAASSAERVPGQQASGLDPRDERQVLIAQARQVQFESPGEAAALYAEVLASDPDDVEALTYRGWTLALDAVRQGDTRDSDEIVAQLREAVGALAQATRLDPTYADPKCFLGIVNFRFLGEPQAAAPWVEACLAAGPPADVRDLVEAMQSEITAALDDTRGADASAGDAAE